MNFECTKIKIIFKITIYLEKISIFAAVLVHCLEYIFDRNIDKRKKLTEVLKEKITIRKCLKETV